MDFYIDCLLVRRLKRFFMLPVSAVFINVNVFVHVLTRYTALHYSIVSRKPFWMSVTYCKQQRIGRCWNSGILVLFYVSGFICLQKSEQFSGAVQKLDFYEHIRMSVLTKNTFSVVVLAYVVLHFTGTSLHRLSSMIKFELLFFETKPIPFQTLHKLAEYFHVHFHFKFKSRQ